MRTSPWFGLQRFQHFSAVSFETKSVEAKSRNPSRTFLAVTRGCPVFTRCGVRCSPSVMSIVTSSKVVHFQVSGIECGPSLVNPWDDRWGNKIPRVAISRIRPLSLFVPPAASTITPKLSTNFSTLNVPSPSTRSTTAGTSSTATFLPATTLPPSALRPARPSANRGFSPLPPRQPGTPSTTYPRLPARRRPRGGF